MHVQGNWYRFRHVQERKGFAITVTPRPLSRGVVPTASFLSKMLTILCFGFNKNGKAPYELCAECRKPEVGELAKCLKPGLHKHNRGSHDVSHHHNKCKKSKPKGLSQRRSFCKVGLSKMFTRFKSMTKKNTHIDVEETALSHGSTQRTRLSIVYCDTLFGKELHNMPLPIIYRTPSPALHSFAQNEVWCETTAM